MHINGADPRTGLEKLLAALEYGTRKEDAGLTDRVLHSFGLKRAKANKLIADILAGPGFEAFFLTIAREAQPFARMLRGVYAFLSQHSVTAERRAEVFRVSGAGARAAFDFDLDAFPREVERILQRIESAAELLELNFGSHAEASAPFVWPGSATEALWKVVRPRWDGDFYGHDFFRAISYAGRMLSDADPTIVGRAKAIVEPIMEQLHALTEALVWEELSPADLELISNMDGARDNIAVQLHTPRRTQLNRDRALSYFLWDVIADSRLGESEPPEGQTAWRELRWILRDMAISVHLWKSGYVRRKDKDDWLAKTMHARFDDITPGKYVRELLEPLAKDYSTKLEALIRIERRIAPDVREALIDFLGLPFWKDRWFLYELWTLCHTLAVAQARWPVELQGVEQRDDGVTEWRLPGGMAAYPIAHIGASPTLECWIQRKTYHPLTGAGLEPDLRIMRATADCSDVFIAENKDRRKPRKKDIQEILVRYVTGTTARCVCMVNYDSFTGPTHEPHNSVAGRDVLVISNFRPIRPPNGDFESRLLEALELELGPPSPQEHAAVAPRRPDCLMIALKWQNEPHDLDLHAWVERSGQTYHVFYGARGNLNDSAYALLGPDARRAPGHETLQLKIGNLTRAVIAVHRFTEGVLSTAGVSLEFYGMSLAPVRFDSVPSGAGGWWRVAEIDGADLSLRVFNELTELPPGSL